VMQLLDEGPVPDAPDLSPERAAAEPTASQAAPGGRHHKGETAA
jgi:hypothetical protein